MSDIDLAGLRRLFALTWDAIAEQDSHVRDQLEAFMRDGLVWFRFVDRDGVPTALVTVGGYDVAEVDIRRLVPLDDL